MMSGNDYKLDIRQQPKAGCVALTKGKDRRPLDPPPIIQLRVSNRVDPHQKFLQNPYLILVAKLVPSSKQSDDPEEQRRLEPKGSDLAGTVVSSLYNLKDTNNSQGGFFVFGDLSVKKEGIFRIEFTLFELKPQNRECWQLCSVTSETFQVFASKAFPGLQESTFLTRCFSDQGVRLRLRKDSRAVITRKRGASGVPQVEQIKSQSMGYIHSHDNHDLSPNGHSPHARRPSALDYDQSQYDFSFDGRASKRMRHNSSSDHAGYDTGYPYTQPSPRTIPEPLVSYPMSTGYPVATQPAVTSLPMPGNMSSFASLHRLDTQIPPHSGGPSSATSTFSPGTRRSPGSAYSYPPQQNNIYASPTHLSYQASSAASHMSQHNDIGLVSQLPQLPHLELENVGDK
ncbi:velvet factor-domain-containing protein [Podospora australis]|uniref:Velvet factor-domain-containing protein n=1 Tax=Podospora australis TaxID=1536484 RepID=A0AAN7AIH3_9PEZI|nr:velvet factor-domain-containing protein [Podospora australis]